MVVGIGTITFRLHGCRSLKAKRKIVKSIMALLANKFNISISEVSAHDVHQKARIGFAIVSNDGRHVNSQLDKVIDTAEALQLAEIVGSSSEMIYY